MEEWEVVEIIGRQEKVNPHTAVARIVDQTEDRIHIRLDDAENLPFWMELVLEKKDGHQEG